MTIPFRAWPVVLAGLSGLLLVGCPTLQVDGQAYACRADGDCAAGWSCGATGFCAREGAPDGGAVASDGGGPDAGPVGDPACGFAALGGESLPDGSRVVQFGGVRTDALGGLAAFPDGGFVAVGDYAADEASFASDGFVAFLSGEGALEGCVRVASSRGEVMDQLRDVAIAPNGDVVAVGRTDGDAGGAEAKSSDLLVVRLARDGRVKWKRQFDFSVEGGASFDDTVTGVTVDGEGTTWVTGDSSGWFEGHPERPSVLGTAGFVLALDADGALIDGRLVPDAADNTHAQGTWPRAKGALVGAVARVGFKSGRKDSQFLHVLEANLDVSRKVVMTVGLELEVSGGEVEGARLTSVGEAGGLLWLAGDVDSGARVGDAVAQGDSDAVVAWGEPGSTTPGAMLLGGEAGEWLSDLALHDGAWHAVGYTLGTLANAPRPGGDGDAVGWSWAPATPAVQHVWQFGGTLSEAADAVVSVPGGVVVAGSSQSTIVAAPWGDADLWLLFLPDPA